MEDEPLEAAWSEVDPRCPKGGPSIDRCSATATGGGTSWPPIRGAGASRPDYVEAIGLAEAQALHDHARLLREWSVED
jgi:hypothetical protein